MCEFHVCPLLIDYFHEFLRDHDVNSFQQKVSSRYAEGTLMRVLSSGDVECRRAAVLALGLMGSYASNHAVASALKDQDSTVRSLADHALWAIWFRADTLENNSKLEEVSKLIEAQRLDAAVLVASELIAKAPEFAEAYNQRAIAYFFMGKFQESLDDCKQTVKRNPYHTGAFAGMGQCYRRLNQPREAILTFRRALKIQPYNLGLQDLITELETPPLGNR